MKDLLTEIDHVAIAVNDLEAAIAWYAEVFGATVDHREKVESTTTSATWRMSSSAASRAEQSARSGTIWTWKVSNASAISASLSGQCR